MNRWQVLIKLIKENDYRNIAEIGVYRGKTTRKILEAYGFEGLTYNYLAVDPVHHIKLSHYLRSKPGVHYIEMTSKEAAEHIGDRFLDLVFLDALHDYDHVMEDIKLWQPKIRPGGILCGDDYNQAHCEGVKQAVDEVFGDRVELISIGRKGVKIWVVRL